MQALLKRLEKELSELKALSTSVLGPLASTGGGAAAFAPPPDPPPPPPVATSPPPACGNGGGGEHGLGYYGATHHADDLAGFQPHFSPRYSAYGPRIDGGADMMGAR